MAMCGKVVLGLVLLCGTSLAQQKPTIGFILPEKAVTVDVGGEVELTCQIKNEGEYPIMWVRLPSEEEKKGRGKDDKFNDNGFPLSTGASLLFRDSRFSLEHDEAIDTYKLTVKNLTLADAAVYQCQVLVGPHERITKEVKVKVKRAATMTERGSPRSVEAKVDEEAVLECVATGVPKPSFVWTRADGRLMYNGRTKVYTDKLTIQRVRKEDRGQYVCTASNDVGEPVNRKITLEVEFAPYISVPRPRVPQAEHFDAELSCHVVAYPAAGITWRRDNKTITNNGNYHIDHFASQGERTTSTLKIAETKSDQFGNYTCEARNRNGFANATVVLYKSKIAICPPVCGDIDLTSGQQQQLSSDKSVFCVIVAFIFHLFYFKG